MKEPTKYSEEWAKIGQDVINVLPELFGHLIELGVDIGYVTSEEAPERNGKKKCAECIALKKAEQKQFYPHDYLIKVYEPNVAYMNDMQKAILMEHELLHINASQDDKGELKLGIRPHDIEDFASIIDKYGHDWAVDLHKQMTLDDLFDDDSDSDIDDEEPNE